MKTSTLACLLVFIAVAGCGKPKASTRFKPMFKNRAIVVLRDSSTGDILRVDTFSTTDLVDTLVYTNGPSVSFACFGDLVNPDVHHMQISGDRVRMQCQRGMIMGVSGETLTFESALSYAFLDQVAKRLANE